MKKLALITTLSIIVSTFFNTPVLGQADDNADNNLVFNDVTSGHQNFVAIRYLKNLGIIDGYEDQTFKPNQEINRAEALKMVIGSFKEVTELEVDVDINESLNIQFSDVPADIWYDDFLTYAVENEIITGYDDGTFKPENVITLAESLAVIFRTLEKPLPEVTESVFSDVDSESWHAPYFAYAKEKQILNVSRSNKVYPNQNLTRGEMAEIIYRTFQINYEAKYGTASYYSDIFEGRNTASGEPFTQSKLTAANLDLDFGTKLLVTNLANGKSVIVTVNDRGPHGHPGRKLDLSRSAFETIGPISRGYLYVEYKIITE